MMKNLKRYPPIFANVNLLGKCNVDCFFCLGKDIEEELAPHNNLKDHYLEWKNFSTFIGECAKSSIENLYITGQNTDALLYKYLENLIYFLQETLKFNVGIRTNGYMFEVNRDLIRVANECKKSVGISIHTLNPETNEKIMGRKHIPDWDYLLPQFHNLRVSIVVNRYNSFEIPDILSYLKQFPNIRYIQLRKVSTDTRYPELKQDQQCFDYLAKIFEKCGEDGDYKILELFYDAKRYHAFGHEIVLWPTILTSINSYNYFTDGTLSLKYFVVEGYLDGMAK